MTKKNLFFTFLLLLEWFFLLQYLDLSEVGVYSFFAGIFLFCILLRDYWEREIQKQVFLPLFHKEWNTLKKTLSIGSGTYLLTIAGIAVCGLLFLPILFFTFPDFSRHFWTYILFVIRSIALFTFSIRTVVVRNKEKYQGLWYLTGLIGGALVLAWTKDCNAYLVVLIFAQLCANLHLSFLAGRRYPHVLRIRPGFFKIAFWSFLEYIPFLLTMVLLLIFQGTIRVGAFATYIMLFVCGSIFVTKEFVEVNSRAEFCKTTTHLHLSLLCIATVLCGCCNGMVQMLGGSSYGMTASVVFLCTLIWYLFFIQLPVSFSWRCQELAV